MNRLSQPSKSPQTVTPEGDRIIDPIAGVKIHYPTTHQDDRGTLCEMYHPAWGFDDLPLVSAYLVTVRPGRVKGWAVHRRQVDRYFFYQGSVKLVLYDDRADSATHGSVNEYWFSESNRALVSVPPGIYHAVECVGREDGVLFNIPSVAYDHENPDKYTLPLENDLIPYSFERERGW